MSKIDELIDSCIFLQYNSDIEAVERIMKEYAENYAKKCLEIAAKEVRLTTGNIYEKEIEFKTVEINPFSITDIKLPDHE